MYVQHQNFQIKLRHSQKKDRVARLLCHVCILIELQIINTPNLLQPHWKMLPSNGYTEQGVFTKIAPNICGSLRQFAHLSQLCLLHPTVSHQTKWHGTWNRKPLYNKMINLVFVKLIMTHAHWYNDTAYACYYIMPAYVQQTLLRMWCITYVHVHVFVNSYWVEQHQMLRMQNIYKLCKSVTGVKYHNVVQQVLIHRHCGGYAMHFMCLQYCQ